MSKSTSASASAPTPTPTPSLLSMAGHIMAGLYGRPALCLRSPTTDNGVDVRTRILRSIEEVMDLVNDFENEDEESNEKEAERADGPKQ